MKTYNHYFLIGLLILGGFGASSCQPEDSAITEKPIDATHAVQTDELLIKVDTLFTEFEFPWGVDWLPNGKMLVTERSGEILIFEDDKYTNQTVTGLPEVYEVGQAGLLDITVHPDYSENGWIYISYAKHMPDSMGALAVMRFKLDGNAAVQKEELITALPAWEGGRHFGSRVVFDNENYLYFSNGDKGNKPENAQDLSNAHGKIHRIHDDGRIPEDNPFVDTPGAMASIWTYGNRNPQGMVFDKVNNRVWESEHGPMGGDELNLIEKGKNYGWPVITYGQNYNGTPITDITEKEGMEQPATYYVPSIATAGMTLVTSDKYPEWQGDILIGALAKMHINRVKMNGTSVESKEIVLQDIGRVREVAESPDGYIYALTEGTGLLIKLIPIPQEVE